MEDSLLQALDEFGWQVQAWAVFTNHYHYIGFSPESGSNAMKVARKLHANTARELNRIDDTPGRRVWYQTWDTAVTYDRSYMARLSYVHHNAVKHGLVKVAEMYPWCSAHWFATHADPNWYETVTSFPTDRVNVEDDF